MKQWICSGTGNICRLQRRVHNETVDLFWNGEHLDYRGELIMKQWIHSGTVNIYCRLERRAHNETVDSFRNDSRQEWRVHIEIGFVRER